MITPSFAKRSILILFVASIMGAAALWVTHTTDVCALVIDDYRPDRDRDFIMHLFKQNWSWLVADNNYSVEFMLDNRASQQFGMGGDLILKVGVVGEKPVGFVAYHKLTFYKGRILFLCVDEQERKKGYAEKLLRYALEQLKAEGHSIAQLVTRTTNIRAQSLYRKVGMKETSRDQDFVHFEIAL